MTFISRHECGAVYRLTGRGYVVFTCHGETARFARLADARNFATFN